MPRKGVIRQKLEKAFEDFDEDHNVFLLIKRIASIADYSVSSHKTWVCFEVGLKEIVDNRKESKRLVLCKI